MANMPRLIMPELAAAIYNGNYDLANQVANLMCSDLAWIIHTMNICGHEQCRDELISNVQELLREMCDDMKEGKQRLDAGRAKEICDAALARALRRDGRGIDR